MAAAMVLSDESEELHDLRTSLLDITIGNLSVLLTFLRMRDADRPMM